MADKHQHLWQNENVFHLQSCIPLTLTELKPGERGRITHINTTTPGILRLMTLGLIEGCEVVQDRAAPGGDPLQLHVHDAILSIRREQALAFTVQPQQ